MNRATRFFVLPVLFLTLVAAAVVKQKQPTARVRSDGVLLVTLPAELLTDRSVRAQLSSGLTTTFLVTVKQNEQRGAARIEVRYEPWDEVYFVTARGVDLSVHRAQLGTLDAVAGWWREAALPVLSPAALSNVIINVEVLPFSIEEQKETQRWLTRSLGEAQREHALDESEIGGSAGGASVLDMLIGTSIQRRPLVSQRWSVRVTR